MKLLLIMALAFSLSGCATLFPCECWETDTDRAIQKEILAELKGQNMSDNPDTRRAFAILEWHRLMCECD